MGEWGGGVWGGELRRVGEGGDSVCENAGLDINRQES